MNTKRIFFWICFVVVLVLIIWGLIVAMNKPDKSATLGQPAPVTSADHVTGPANAPVTIIEYSDFQCPACEAYYPWVEKLINESSSTVRFVYRHFPLSQHPNAIPAARAAEAASVQGKFWEMYNQLFSNHVDWTELSDPSSVFAGYAAKIGLNADEFKADSASSTLLDKINANEDEGIKLGINSTPTFFINGKAIVNPSSYDAFKALVQAAASGGTQ